MSRERYSGACFVAITRNSDPASNCRLESVRKNPEVRYQGSVAFMKSPGREVRARKLGTLRDPARPRPVHGSDVDFVWCQRPMPASASSAATRTQRKCNSCDPRVQIPALVSKAKQLHRGPLAERRRSSHLQFLEDPAARARATGASDAAAGSWKKGGFGGGAGRWAAARSARDRRGRWPGRGCAGARRGRRKTRRPPAGSWRCGCDDSFRR